MVYQSKEPWSLPGLPHGCPRRWQRAASGSLSMIYRLSTTRGHLHHGTRGCWSMNLKILQEQLSALLLFPGVIDLGGGRQRAQQHLLLQMPAPAPRHSHWPQPPACSSS